MNTKSIFHILIILLLFCVISTCFITTANAVCVVCDSTSHSSTNHDCQLCTSTHDVSKLDLIQRFAYEASEKVYGNSVWSALETWFKFDVSSGNLKTLWDKGREVYNVVLPFGEMLAVIYTFIAMLEGLSSDNLTGEHIARQLIKLFASIMVLKMGFDLLTALVTFTNGAFDFLQNNISSGSPSGSTTLCVYSDLADNNGKYADVKDALALIIRLIVPFVVTMAATVAAYLVIWARILEIVVRVMFAPLGMADLVAKGRSGNGFKYLKRLLAALMTGTVMLAIMRAYSYLSVMLSGNGNFIISLILVTTLITTIFKASELSKDILGV